MRRRHKRRSEPNSTTLKRGVCSSNKTMRFGSTHYAGRRRARSLSSRPSWKRTRPCGSTRRYATRQTEAVRAAAETAQQHEAALTALHAQLDDAEARRVQLEQDHAVRVDTMRQEAEAALAILAKELETQAAEQVAAAVREAQTQAANRLAETTKEHELALANVRTDAQADTAQAEDRLAALTQEFADGVEAQATAQIEVVRATAKTAQQHEAALAAVQAQLDDADARRVQLEQSHAARAYRTARRRQAASGWAA